MSGAAHEPRTEIRHRPIEAGDLPFLAELYASTRWRELAPTGWSDDRKRTFLTMQFEAQHRHYMEHFGDADFDLLLRAGRPIGRLYHERRTDEIRLIDIALLPELRGRGIGGTLLGELLARADAEGLAVRLHVERDNPAYRLYRRLGFAEVEPRGVYVFMERPAVRGAPAGR